MKIKLVAYTQGVTPEVGETPSELIAYCARVSNSANQNNHATGHKLVNYLLKHRHWSPLEMVSATLEIETTRDIARQILRHRSFSFQEFSQRYADPTKELEFELREARLQDNNNRQDSLEVDDVALQDEWRRRQAEVLEAAQNAYKWAIERGIAKEQARAVLPEGLTMSRLYMSGTLRSWIHYIELRRENGTQKEHSLIAKEVAKVISEIFPLTSIIDEV